MQLASLSIADGALEKGAELLRELPEQTFDPTALWALYYLKKDQPKQALELTQKQLYKLANQILACLGTLTMPKLMSEPCLLYTSRVGSEIGSRRTGGNRE